MSDEEKTIDQSTAETKAATPNRAKKGRGNLWIPDEEQHRQIKVLVAMGTLTADIALVIGVSAPTIRRVIKQDPDLRSAAVQADAKVTQSLYKMATRERNPVPAAAIFWKKARNGWSDRPDPAGDTPAKKAQRQANAQRVGSSGKLAPGKGPAKLSVVK